MDPITLIVTALAAGAAAGLKDTATSAVKDAYAGLRDLVRRKFGDRQAGTTALVQHERAPEVWQAPLAAELQAAGAGRDHQLIDVATRLMSLLDEAGARAGKYEVDARGAQGVQIGDGNEQSNMFTAPPSM